MQDILSFLFDEKKLGGMGIAALLPGVRFIREMAQQYEDAMQAELEARRNGDAPAKRRGPGRPRLEDVPPPGLTPAEQVIVNEIEAVTRPGRGNKSARRGRRPAVPDMIDGNYTAHGAAKLLGLSPGSMWTVFTKNAVGRKTSWPKGSKAKVLVVTPAEMNRLLRERGLDPVTAPALKKQAATKKTKAGLNKKGKPVTDNYWSRMTPEERKAEMQRRVLVHRGQAPSARIAKSEAAAA